MNGTTGVPESATKTPSISKTTTSDMSQYVGLTRLEHRYVLEFGDDARARAYLDSIGLDARRPVIALNTGAGGRWPLKQKEEGYVELVARFRPSRRRAGPAPGRVGRA